MIFPHTLEVIKPTYGADEYGTPSSEASWSSAGDQVKAYVQPRSTREFNSGAERSTVSSDYIAYVKSDTQVSSNDRAVWNDIEFEVVGIRHFETPRGPHHIAVDLRYVTEASNG